MKTIKINKCRECPYLFSQNVIYCNKKQDWIKDDTYNNRVPYDCPLEDFNDRYWEGYDRCCAVNNLSKIKH
jgi:hypothetical protein